MYFFDHKLNVVIRHSELKKSMLFVLLSACLMYVISGLASGQSVLSLPILQQFWEQSSLFLLSSLSLCLLLYFLKARMKYLFLVYILYCGVRTFVTVLNSFHLIIIILLFIYILVGAYFFILTSNELERAAYFPQVHVNDILPAKFLELSVSDREGNLLGDVTNFDSKSCFVKIQNETKNIEEIVFNFEGHQFFALCKVVARSVEGLGFVLFDNDMFEKKWSDLYKIFKQRGYEKFFRGE